MEISLEKYWQQVQQELEKILAYWMQYTIDTTHGGFFGQVDNANNPSPNSPKGSVLNSRILWTFSAAYRQTNTIIYLQTAQRAYQYIGAYFIDKDFGGVYWSVDCNGRPHNTKKQVYAIAFAIYGLSEYVLAIGDENAKKQAIELYNTMEAYSHDKGRKGYIEAFTRDWSEMNDLRLSSKDSNERKTMNTHLHVLEAYTNLYRCWPAEELKINIVELIQIFLHYIINPVTNHLQLFFDEDWNNRSKIVSYGHDIEAAWLLQEAAEIIGEDALLNTVKQQCVLIAKAAENGVDQDGGMWYEKEGDHLVKEKHWWPQAEAMVGFYNAYQLTSDVHFLGRSINTWNFIQQYIIDKQKGEWFWGVKEDYSIVEEDKVGIWKCPYHNGRACLEIMKRVER